MLSEGRDRRCRLAVWFQIVWFEIVPNIAYCTSSRKVFQKMEAATGNERRPAVDRWYCGMCSCSVNDDRRRRRRGRLDTSAGRSFHMRAPATRKAQVRMRLRVRSSFFCSFFCDSGLLLYCIRCWNFWDVIWRFIRSVLVNSLGVAILRSLLLAPIIVWHSTLTLNALSTLELWSAFSKSAPILEPGSSRVGSDFYPRDAMLARVIGIATCLSVCLSVHHAPVLCQKE